MRRWRSRGPCLIVALGLIGGPARAAPPSCPLDEERREAIRDHNTKAKQDFEEEKYLLAAQEWLAAQAAVPAEAGCADQRATRVDLALRSLGSYNTLLRYEPADAAILAEVVPLLRSYAESLPEDERRATIVARADELECVRAALPDREAALECTPAGRASKPAPAPEPESEPRPEPAPAPVVAPAPVREDPGVARRRRGLAIGFGVSLGLGAGALGAALGTWAAARTGGSQHRAIRDAAAGSVADDDPGNDVPPNLPPDQDYCAVARADGPRNPTIADLCDRHDRTAAASIATFTLAGVFAAAGVTLAALWARAPRPSRHAARAWRVDVAPTRGGATIGGVLRF